VALWERIYAAQYTESSPGGDVDQFRFLASASIRGDICPGCRSEKIESLGRFAALYSDETTIPLPLTRPGRDTDLGSVRVDILKTVESLIRLRPLIQPGIARPAVMSTAVHCEHELASTQELIDLASLCAEELADEHSEQFEMLYEPGTEDGDLPKLYIRGPEDYIEHGEVVIRFPEPPQWIAKSWRPGPDGLVRIPAKKARKTGLVQALFQRIASDTTFQLAYGTPRRAKLLTDLPGDTELLRGLDQEDVEVQNQRAILLNALSHALPFTNELSLEQTVRLREELRGAFEQYRFAITSIVRSHERGSRSHSAKSEAVIQRRIAAEDRDAGKSTGNRTHKDEEKGCGYCKRNECRCGPWTLWDTTSCDRARLTRRSGNNENCGSARGRGISGATGCVE
jgi:hypothetical protein